MKRVTSFEEACAEQGLDPNKVIPDVSNCLEKDKDMILSVARMAIIQRSLNNGWEPDWADEDQPKYFPWYWVNEDKERASGFGLSRLGVRSDSTSTRLGVRLHYKDEETAEYAFETFKHDYENMVLIPK